MVLKPLKKVFLTGGSGTLGIEMRKKSPQLIAPSKDECNILLLGQIEKNLDIYKPEIFIHAAGFTNVKSAEEDSDNCIDINVMGTINVIKACRKRGIKLVFISTDYVFDGKRGYYKLDDPINPLSYYAKTKGAAELIVRTYPNHLIIRTSFFGYDFPYDKALIDQWTTKDYVDIIAPKILKEAMSNKIGVVHVGSERRSIYEIAKTRNPSVKEFKMENINFPIPRDVSLEVCK